MHTVENLTKILKRVLSISTGLLLLFKVLAATSCVTLAASLATRLGTTPMAAFQICLQVWLTSSLLADGLAVAGQVEIRSCHVIIYHSIYVLTRKYFLSNF